MIRNFYSRGDKVAVPVDVNGTECTPEEAAYHEAGHAVAAWRYSVKINHISIVPKNGVSHGRLLIDPMQVVFDNSENERKQAERAAVVHLAGQVAQWQYYNSFKSAPRSRGSLHHAGSDFQFVTDIIGRLHGSGDSLSDFLQEMHTRATELVSSEWLRIDRLAKKLIEKGELTGEQVTGVLEMVGTDAWA